MTLCASRVDCVGLSLYRGKLVFQVGYFLSRSL
jgi:hypothetical protein